MRTSKRQYRALVQIHYELFPGFDVNTTDDSRIGIDESSTDSECTLPDINSLYRMFDTYNDELFKRRLPRVRISYSNRMLIAGSYTPALREIKLGRKYHKIFPDDLSDTLKHEMIHIIYPRHDRKFKALAARLKVSLKARAHPDLRGPYKYLYICPSCGREYPRRKRFRMASCGICSRGNRFDPKFKLRLADSRNK
jgi:predicted SprT family Zn-dependent metalloprotease